MGEQDRLGISGQMNLIVGIFKRKAGKIVAQRVIGFFVKVANSIKSIEKVFRMPSKGLQKSFKSPLRAL